MQYTLGKAAEATGKSKSTINRAIKSGKLSAHRNDDGSYAIDPSELARAFPAPIAQPAAVTQAETVAEPAGTDAALAVKVEMLEAQIAREQDTIDDLRKRLDKAEDRAYALTFEANTKPPHPRGLWARLTGR